MSSSPTTLPDDKASVRPSDTDMAPEESVSNETPNTQDKQDNIDTMNENNNDGGAVQIQEVSDSNIPEAEADAAMVTDEEEYDPDDAPKDSSTTTQPSSNTNAKEETESVIDKVDEQKEEDETEETTGKEKGTQNQAPDKTERSTESSSKDPTSETNTLKPESPAEPTTNTNTDNSTQTQTQPQPQKSFSSLRESMERKTKATSIPTGDLNEYYRQQNLHKKQDRESQEKTFDMLHTYTKKENYMLQTTSHGSMNSMTSMGSATSVPGSLPGSTVSSPVRKEKVGIQDHVKGGKVEGIENSKATSEVSEASVVNIIPSEASLPDAKSETALTVAQGELEDIIDKVTDTEMVDDEAIATETEKKVVEVSEDESAGNDGSGDSNREANTTEAEQDVGTDAAVAVDSVDVTDLATESPHIETEPNTQPHAPQLDLQEELEPSKESTTPVNTTPTSSDHINTDSNVVIDSPTEAVNTNMTIDVDPGTSMIDTIDTGAKYHDKASDNISDISNSSHALTSVDIPPTNTTSSVNGTGIHIESGGSEANNIMNTLSTIVATSESEESDRIQLGICAMDKKAKSKPMGEILKRMDSELFEVVMFGDEMILQKPVKEWPLCDALIAFYSNGYPLAKVEEYVELRKPFVLNDLKMQRELMDRRRVYDLLKSSGIDVPRHVYMNRDGYVSRFDESGEELRAVGDDIDEQHDTEDEDDESEEFDDVEEDFVEHDDHIEVNGVVIHKPFVEKPVDADDHNIAIYYPMSAGGGCKKLFRKVGDRSSEFYPEINEVRRDGSFIYESFLETQGTDVKMYTVGPDYGHAEARKSPTVDGRVERNKDGKEVRFPVILTLREKEIARRIVLVFKQQVCGFDLLRVQEGDSLVSYVCDVNGWSFVKNSRKYYDDCAQILTEHMLAVLKPMALVGFSALDPLSIDVKNVRPETPSKKKRQRSQGRTPTVFTHRKMLKGVEEQNQVISAPSSPYRSREGSDTESTNAAATLQEGAGPVRDLPDMLMHNPASISTSSRYSADDETPTAENLAPNTHQEELRCVIAVVRHGDRTPKQKLKFNIKEPLLLQYFHDHTDNCKKDLKIKAKKPMTEFLETVKLMVKDRETRTDIEDQREHRDILLKLHHVLDVLMKWKIVGLNRKLQLKPRKWVEYRDENDDSKILRCVEVQLILKWGGNLTKLGEKQSISLGQRFRHQMYPDREGGGILRLHSTFRHDMKIKTSDEGRVMKTAAAFAKGLLELEGEIPPILISLVHKEKDSLHMLDPSGNKEVSLELDACKKKINDNLQKDFDANDSTSLDKIDLEMIPSLKKALEKVGNPRQVLFTIRETIGILLDKLDEMLGLMASDVENRIEGGEGLKGDEVDEALSGIKLYKGETLLELTERWRLLYKKLYDDDKDTFDLSRVPDVHDNVRFDMLHNPHLGLTTTLEKLYTYAKLMADVVVPQEYGTSVKEKTSIGNKNCHALLEKIKYDLIIARTDNQVDMRYLINMDYGSDLPINTMGRRIRTRLYFTSESHLHTLLNVLRFHSSDDEAKKAKPILSKSGIETVCAAPELCYLTQIVMRLFENTKKDPDDPKRFRIEILFSPGATATPLHMSEMDRNNDSTRFDTEPLQLISKENLTCQEVEDYFNFSIEEGKTGNDDDLTSNISTVDDPEMAKEMKKMSKPKKEKKISRSSSKTASSSKSEKSVMIAEEKNTEIEPEDDCSRIENLSGSESTADKVPKDKEKKEANHVGKNEGGDSNDAKNEIVRDDKKRLVKMTKVLAKQAFWTGLAAVTAFLGIGCLVMSRNVHQQDFNARRRWSRR